MDIKEKIEHEEIKNAIKLGIMNNCSLNVDQKKQAIDNLERAARQADWFVEMLKLCGYIK